MIYRLLYIMGLIIYATAEGITEAKMWDKAVETKNALFTAKYHSFRLLEYTGIGIIIFSIFRPTFWQAFLIAFITLGIGFYPYRKAFVKVRKQSEFTPTWKYAVWVPYINAIIWFSYPKEVPLIIWFFAGIFLTLLVTHFGG